MVAVARIASWCAVPALLGLAACAAPARTAMEVGMPAADAPRILVFTQTLGWRHDSIPDAVDALRAVAAAEGVAVVHSEDPAMFDAARLSGVHAVVFANTTGNLLDPAQRAALEHFVRGGGGFLGLHSAADTGYDWPWYGALVGAWFDSHPPDLQTTDVRFERGHPRPGGGAWRVTDEIYNYRDNPRPRVDVVATVDPALYAGGTMGDDHPIAWCHARFGGRAWYTGLGHARAIHADPVYRAHLARGLRFVLRRAQDC